MTCKKNPPHRRLQAPQLASLPLPPLPAPRPALQQLFASPSLAFLPPLTTTGQRASMTSPAGRQSNTTPGSSTAQALMDIMRRSPEGEGGWLLSEISNFNVPVKRRCFPKDASLALRDTLDDTLFGSISPQELTYGYERLLFGHPLPETATTPLTEWMSRPVR